MKYFKLWLYFFRTSWMAEAEYRFHMIIKICSELIWYSAQLSVFEVMFYHAPQIAGWDIHSMRVFLGVLFIVDATYMILFHENFEQASNLVRKGELDFILAKPINSQFMFSCRKVNPVYLINLVMIACYLGWALSRLPHLPSLLTFAHAGFLMICGLTVLYSLRFFFAALSVIFTNAASLQYVWYQFYRLGTRPHVLYPPWLRWLLVTVLPVGMIVSVPATKLVHDIDGPLLWLSPALAISLFYLTTRYWKFILRKYSSASS